MLIRPCGKQPRPIGGMWPVDGEIPSFGVVENERVGRSGVLGAFKRCLVSHCLTQERLMEMRSRLRSAPSHRAVV